MELTELVRKAQSGDQEAMSELYQQTCQRVYALALRLTSDPDRAMDAVQESYLSALQNLDKLQKPEAFLHWIFQITANCCRKFHNREKRYVSPEQGEEESDYFASIPDPNEKILPEAAADSGETRRLVLELVDRLPPEQRECVVLYYFSECSVEEISRLQACTENTVKSRLNYARKKLKEGVLALEARDGIRLHSFAPIGLLLACTGEELPAAASFLHIWQNVAAGLGTAGAAAASTAAAAASAGEAAGTGTAAAGTGAAASGGHTAAGAAAKGVAGALKMKVAAGLAAGAVLAGGAGIVLSQSPAVTFSDPAFEQNIRVLLDIPSGTIREDDLEEIYTLSICGDGMSIYSYEAEEGTGPVSSLEDLSLFPDLWQVIYQISDEGALLETLPVSENILSISVNVNDVEGPGVSDLSFLDKLPQLKRLGAHLAPGVDLTPAEQKTTLMSLGLILEGSDTLDISQLTNLRLLDFWGPEDIEIALGTSNDLPELQILYLPGGSRLTSSLDVLYHMPALEFLNLNAAADTDLTPLGQLKHLRAAILDYNGRPADLTPLAQCPNLEVCSTYALPEGSIVPPGLPMEIGSHERSFDIYDEVLEEVNQAIWPTN